MRILSENYIVHLANLAKISKGSERATAEERWMFGELELQGSNRPLHLSPRRPPKATKATKYIRECSYRQGGGAATEKARRLKTPITAPCCRLLL